MKAILNVHKKGAFGHCNGLTFEVKEVLTSGNKGVIYGLVIDGHTTDFTEKEVMICDLQIEMQSAFDGHNWGDAEATRKFRALEKYCIANGIKFQPEYNCLP